MRSLAFKAMLRQEIAWFDEEHNSSGALTTQLAADAGKIQGATGTRLGTLMETTMSLLAAFVISFAYTWVLTLLMLGMMPLLFFFQALEFKFLVGITTTSRKSLEKAGKV